MDEAHQIVSDCQDITQCLVGAASYIQERFARSKAINGQAQPLPPKPANIKRPVTKPVKVSGHHLASTDSHHKLASQ